MACRMVGAKPLSEPMQDIINWSIRNQLQWNFNRNNNISSQENVFESVVCEMASILSRLQCVSTNILWELTTMSSVLEWFVLPLVLCRSGSTNHNSADRMSGQFIFYHENQAINAATRNSYAQTPLAGNAIEMEASIETVPEKSVSMTS